ncbi:Sec-independent protein translocase protein TatB [Sphingomonas sp.]|uniref:Sec-independent protein translocase protein TatB n=1 Tax=Sphingomonas sp. TaxID=28214 RepID=UPI0039C9A9A0
MLIFDIAPTELLVLGAVALLVIPPKDLPRAMRVAGKWVGRARGMARQFRSSFDDMIRESEFAEMEQKWKAENERIMREFPQTSDMAQLMAPVPHDVPDPPADTDARPAMSASPDMEHEPAPQPKPKKPRAKPKANAKPKADAKNAGIERL